VLATIAKPPAISAPMMAINFLMLIIRGTKCNIKEFRQCVTLCYFGVQLEKTVSNPIYIEKLLRSITSKEIQFNKRRK
jgi:hypothetical protein